MPENLPELLAILGRILLWKQDYYNRGGGAVTAKDPTEVEHLKYLSTQAKDDPHFYIHNEVGYNYRMTNLQAGTWCGTDGGTSGIYPP